MSKLLPVLQDDAAPAGAALPAVYDSVLDWDAVDCVLADLDDFAEIRELAARRADGQVVPQDDIVEARNGLRSGDYQGLQITYLFADELWIDTLLRAPEGAALSRMLSPTA